MLNKILILYKYILYKLGFNKDYLSLKNVRDYQKALLSYNENLNMFMSQAGKKFKPINEGVVKMSKLTTKQRKKLPKSDFALPSKRKYPVNDKSHAKNAMARASEMEHKGKISKGTQSKIDSKARKVLKGKTPKAK